MTNQSLQLAIDAGPLYGHRTGVGVAVSGMVTALEDRSDVELMPYLVSFRATPHDGHRRLPVPGIVASHVWSRFDRPTSDRWLAGADVVHGTNYVAPPSSRPTVLSVYDCWFLANPGAASAVVRRAGLALRRRVAAGAWVHTTSESTSAQARELLDTNRVRTIHLGAPVLGDVPTQTPGALTRLGGRPYVLCIGTEERRKGLPLAIEAFAQFAPDHPELALVLAGAAGDDSGVISETISSTGTEVGSRIHRLGVVDDDTKAWLVRHATALAYPSVDEGFGIPILEANTLGTPVVATAAGSIAEIAGDAAELVGDRHPESFAASLASVVTDGGRRLGLIEAGFRNVRRFRWDTTAEELRTLYADAMGDS